MPFARQPFREAESSTLTRPSPPIMTLAGSRSRCVMPCWCAAATASASGIAISKRRRYYGTEFVSAAMDLWTYTNSVILDFSRRGKPTDNGGIESFNGRLREECFNVHSFASLEDASKRSMRFGGTTMSIVLTELSRI